jgi:ketosteroid isomerase-like protein
MATSRAGDLPALLDLTTDDVVFMVPGLEPFGKAEFVADGEGMRRASLEGRAEIREIEIFGPRADGTTSISC